ncbi:MAG: acyl-CoA dehydratase activase [Planctomycetota bacterium]|jgi:predicted CoA-substrate-specific enzyme activase
MSICAGIDVGSTYTKAVLLKDGKTELARSVHKTGFRLPEVARRVYDEVLAEAGLTADDVDYVVSTGFGRNLVEFRDVKVTDITAAARGTRLLHPATRTVLDIGGQTMKATRVDEEGKVRSFRLNDKCAAGTGAFIEKTARYMGFGTAEIGPLAATSKSPATISGVCAVFAESEVINHLSQGCAPADIMQGAIVSLVDRAVQLLKRVRMEPDVAVIGGILRFPSMGSALQEQLGDQVFTPKGNDPQFVSALGAAVLGHRRLEQTAAVT